MPQKPVKTSASGVGKRPQKHNDKLGSREGAAELLGISVSSLADYELGNTKVIPVDKVVLMADIYNAPELMAWYCSSECLIGKSLEMPSPEIASVERTTMKLLKRLRQGDIEQVKEKAHRHHGRWHHLQG